MDLLDLYVNIGVKDNATSEIKNFGKSAKKAVGGLAIGAAVATGAKELADFASESVSVGMEFDQAMSQVAATGGMTMEELEDNVVSTSTAYGDFTGNLREFSQFLGSNTAFSATQAAEGLNYMALAGYDAQTSVEMLPSVLNLAAAGAMELGDASDMLTDVQSALGLSMEETYTLVDQMAGAAASSNTSVSQLGSALLTVGGTAKDLSGGTLEAATALGILANNGIKGAEGGTALRNILLSTIPKSDEAASAFEQLGLSFYDADGNMRPLNESFGDLATSLSGMSAQEKTEVLSAIFNKVDLKSVAALLSNSADELDQVEIALVGVASQSDDYEQFWNGIMDGLDATGKEYDDLRQDVVDSLDDQGHATDRTRQVLLDYGISAEQADFIMEQLGDTVVSSQSGWDGLEKKIAGSWTTLSSLQQSMQDAGLDMGDMRTSMEDLGITSDEFDSALAYCNGDAELFAQMLANSADEGVSLDDVIGTMGGSLGDVQTAFDNATGAAQQMADTQVDNLAGDITLAKSALEGLQIAISDHVSPVLRDFVQAGTTAISGLAALVSGDQKSADAKFKELGEQIGATWDDIQTGVDEAIPALQTFFENLPGNILTWVGDLAKTLSDSGTDLIQGFFDGFGTVVPMVADFFLSLPTTVVTLVGDVIETLLPAGADLIQGMYDGATGLLDGDFGDWLTKLPSTILDSIGSLAGTLIDSGADLLSGLMAGIAQISPSMLGFFESLPGVLGGMLGDLAGYLVDKGADFIGGFFSGTSTSEAAQGLVDFFAGIPDTLLGLLGEVETFLSTAGENFLQGFADGMGVPKEDVEKLFADLPQTLLDKLGDLTDFLGDKGGDLIGGFISGVTTGAGDLVTMLAGLGGNAIEWIGDTLPVLATQGMNLLAGFYSGFSEVLNGTFKDDMSAFLERAAGFVGESIATLAGAGIDFILGFINGAKGEEDTEGVNFFGTFLDLVKQVITTGIDVATFLGEIGTSLISGFLDGVSGGKWTEIKEWFAALPQTIVDNITGVPEALLETGKSLITGFYGGVMEVFGLSESDAGTVVAFASNLPSKIVETIGDMGETLLQAGKDVIDGFLDGVAAIFGGDGDTTDETVAGFVLGIPGKIAAFVTEIDPISLLSQAGTDLIQGFVDAFNDFSLRDFIVGVFGELGGAVCDVLGIQSPSTVFYDIGQNVVAGAQGGIEDNESSLDGALTGIADGLPANFADAYWAMHDMGAGLATSFEVGMSNTFNRSVAQTLAGIAQTLPSWFGGYYTLWSAGQQIMAGLGDSMVSYFNSTVAAQLQAITNAIPQWKGPLDRDRDLLTANGEAIMGSLVAGIVNGREELQGVLGGITGDIPGMVGVATTGAAGTSVTVNMERAFEGANLRFNNRKDMEEFSETFAQYTAEAIMGRYQVA